MSRIGEKKSTGASDGTKFSGAKKQLLIRKDADIYSVLEQFEKNTRKQEESEWKSRSKKK